MSKKTPSPEHIAKDLQPLARPVAELKLDPNNANKHSARNLEAIKRSLKRFKQQKPIVVLTDGTIIAGNGTYEAALALGWQNIACSTFENREDAVAYAIADNKTGQLAEWDFEVLSEQLRAMDEETRLDTGFAEFETAPLLAAEWDPPSIKDIPNTGGHHNVSLDQEQWDVFTEAYTKLTKTNKEMTRGEALVALCKSYLGS